MKQYDIFLNDNITDYDILICNLISREVFSVQNGIVVYSSVPSAVLYSLLKIRNGFKFDTSDVQIVSQKYLRSIFCPVTVGINAIFSSLVSNVCSAQELSIQSNLDFEMRRYRKLYEADPFYLNEMDTETLRDLGYIIVS